MNASTAPFDEYLTGANKAAVIYSAGAKFREMLKEKDLSEWLVFVWMPRDGHLVPADIKPTSRARFQHSMMHEAEEPDPNHVGVTTDVKFTQFPGSPTLKAKVDTGATISSLHAEKWKVGNGQVSFICPEISKNVLTVPLAEQQAVKSADGGVEYRPVIETNVAVNGKMLQGVQFNLNDRGQMKYPVLVGHNILDKGNFLVNPKMEGEEESTETVLTEDDWKIINEAIADVELPDGDPTVAYTPEDVETLLKTLTESEVPFAELIRHVRGVITESVKTVEY